MSDPEKLLVDPNNGSIQRAPEATPEPHENGSTEPFFVLHNSTFHEELLQDVITDIVNDEPGWPDMQFEFSDSYMVGGGIMDSTPLRRLATSLRSIRNVAPESVEEKSPDDPEVRLRSISRFLKSAVKVDTTGLEMQRRDIINPDEVTEKLFPVLEKQHDPVAQALEQIRHEYAGSLEEQDIKRLATDLLFATKHRTIDKIYKAYIKRLNVAGNALLRLMMP